MENPKLLTKKVAQVLLATLLGAMLFDAMILAAKLEYVLWKRGTISGPFHEAFLPFAYALVVPSALLTNATGYTPGLLNEYAVNGVLGALVFGLVAVMWQLVRKGFAK